MTTPYRTFGVGEILDGAFTIYRRNFVTFFGVALMPYLPLMVLMPLVGVGGDALVVALAPLWLLVFPYLGVMWIVSTAGLTWAAVQGYRGYRPRIGPTLTYALRRFLPLFVATFLSTLLIFLGFLALVVPGLIAASMFMLVYAVILIENRGGLESLGRSRSLTRGGRLRILGIWILATVITYLPAIGLGILVGVGAVLTSGPANLDQPGAFDTLATFLQLVVTALTTPFLASVVGLLYVDRRARTEAPELEGAVELLMPRS